MASMAPTLRPLSCWKSILRHSRRQKESIRSLVTAAQTYTHAVPPSIPKYPIEDVPGVHKMRKIKTYPPPPSPAANFKEPIKAFQADQINILDPHNSRTQLFSKANSEAAKVGDILLVRQKNGDPFAGVCINIRRRGVDTAILLRNQLTRVGVEMWYKIYSPNVEGIEVVQRRPKRARRARLTYMRKPKHDAGSVQNIVTAYVREKAALRGGGGRVRAAPQSKNKKKGNKKK